jgi:hypothetical protein
MSDRTENDAKRSGGDISGGDLKRTKSGTNVDGQLTDLFPDTMTYNGGDVNSRQKGDPLDFDFNKFPTNYVDSKMSTNGLGTIQNVPNYGSVPLKQESNMKRPMPQYSMSTSSMMSSNINPSEKLAGDQKLHTNDPTKLNDAIAAAGVDIQQEEELLLQQQQHRNFGIRHNGKVVKLPPFLNSYHVAAFMNKVAKENGIQQNFLQDAELLELVSTACEYWLSNIINKTIILSQHRRRGIPQNLIKRTQDKKSMPSIPRSELSKELRNLAVRQKELEEKRVNKRIMLGLEKTSNDPNDPANADGKAGAEETLHRAANATAAMMTMNPGRKKYSWMTAGSSANSESKIGAETPAKGKQSSIITARGDNGLRYREIRSGNSVNMKDLLTAIEDERIGTFKATMKGYAKLKE